MHVLGCSLIFFFLECMLLSDLKYMFYIFTRLHWYTSVDICVCKIVCMFLFTKAFCKSEHMNINYLSAQKPLNGFLDHFLLRSAKTALDYYITRFISLSLPFYWKCQYMHSITVWRRLFVIFVIHVLYTFQEMKSRVSFYRMVTVYLHCV